MNKKGISGVLVTVLLILIGIAAIAIVFVAVNSFISGVPGEVEQDLLLSSFSLDKVELKANGQLEMVISRDSGETQTDGVQILVYDAEGNNKIYLNDEIKLNTLEKKTVQVELEAGFIPERVEVYPYKLDDGKQVLTKNPVSKSVISNTNQNNNDEANEPPIDETPNEETPPADDEANEPPIDETPVDEILNLISPTSLPIARWDTIPFQNFNNKIKIGVVAFHPDGIKKVEFYHQTNLIATVNEMSLNTETNVIEYWTELDASNYPDGVLEIKAIVYSNNNNRRELSGSMTDTKASKGEYSLFLNVNRQSSLAERSVYVSNSGDDTTGDGSRNKPYLTIMKAARAIKNSNSNGLADNGIIYLEEGQYLFGIYSSPLDTGTANTWLTITRASGADKSKVIINESGTSAGIKTKLVKLDGITVKTGKAGNYPLRTPSSPAYYLWIEDSEMIGFAKSDTAAFTNGWAKIYVTNSVIGNSMNGMSGDIVRNVLVRNIASDAFSGSGLVVNSEAQFIDRTGTDFHPDIYQSYDTKLIENRIVYGLKAIDRIGAQGLFAGASIAIKDMAFVKVEIDNRNPINSIDLDFRVIQFGGSSENVYLKDSKFNGGTLWRNDLGFMGKQIVIENTKKWDGTPLSISFSENPSAEELSGIIYI